jgi:hypothetical protein
MTDYRILHQMNQYGTSAAALSVVQDTATSDLPRVRRQ